MTLCFRAIFIMWILLPLGAAAQFTGKTEITINARNKTGQVKMERYNFDLYVHDCLIDTSGTDFFLAINNSPETEESLMKPKNVFMRFSTEGNTIRWKSKKYPYSIERVIGHILLSKNANPSERLILDYNTGKELWKADFELLGYNYEDSTLFTHQIAVNHVTNDISVSQLIDAIGIANGDLKWTVKAPLMDFYNVSNWVNDSILIIQNNGIHFLNVKQKKLKEFVQKTQTLNYKVKEDPESGTVTYSPRAFRYPKITTTLKSNLFRHGDSLYRAGNENIACLTTKGDLVWTAPLNPENSSQSSLFLVQGNLWMINKGIVTENGIPKLGGLPFVRVYDPRTGNALFEHSFTPTSWIRSSILYHNKLLLVVDKKIWEITTSPQYMATEREFGDSLANQFDYFLNRDFFYFDTKGTIRYQSDTTDFTLVKTKNGNAIMLDSNLLPVKQYSANRMLFAQYEGSKFKIYQNKENLFVTDMANNIIINMAGVESYIVRDKYLFLFGKKHIDRIKLADLE